MRASVVINERASGSHKKREHLIAALDARQIDVDDIATVDGHDELERHIRHLAKAGAEAVFVGGGDGSMMIAANALAHRDTVLGVLPFGTGNSFARTIGIEPTIDSALTTIAGGRIAEVDLGMVNDRYFVNFATVGLPAEIAAETPHALKPVLGAAAYAVGGILPFLRAKPFRARIRWNEGELTLKTQQMVIASGRFFGRVPVLPDASISDGKLAFFTTGGVSHAEVARMYVAFALGLQTLLPDAHTFSAPKIRLRTKRNVPISLDGDPGGTTPATFRIARRALRVFVPAAYIDRGR